MFPKPLLKGPSFFPDVFFLTTCMGTFESVHYPTLFNGSILFLGGHQKIVEGVVTSEMRLFKCTQTDYMEEYIWELGRTFWDRLKEHHRALSPIQQHSLSTGHPINVDSFFMMGSEVHSFTRTIKEAMFILVNDASLNRKPGSY